MIWILLCKYAFPRTSSYLHQNRGRKRTRNLSLYSTRAPDLCLCFMLLLVFFFATWCGVRSKSEMESKTSKCPAGYWRDVCLTPFIFIIHRQHTNKKLSRIVVNSRNRLSLSLSHRLCSEMHFSPTRNSSLRVSVYVFKLYLDHQNVCNLFCLRCCCCRLLLGWFFDWWGEWHWPWQCVYAATDNCRHFHVALFSWRENFLFIFF